MEKYIENNPYLDYEKLYETFASFGMIHADYDNNMVAGTTLRGLNIITIYDYENAKKDPYYITTLQHEIIHLTGHLDNFVLNEGMTELLQAEYFNDGNATGYYEYVIFTKIFCELIGSDKMLEAYSKNDMSIIQEEMLKINPSEHDYDSLMNAMQEYGTKYQMADELKELPDVDKYPFYLLLLPYLKSDKLSETTQTEILHYIEHLDSKTNYNTFKFYFNIKDDEQKILYWDGGSVYWDNNGNVLENPTTKK